jgi:N-formylglutamate amidohydrolase
MKPALPILVIIPHGGYAVPEELAGAGALTEFDLFFEADACANELFYFGDLVKAHMDTETSRLFVDVDRHHLMLPPRTDDGVIKRETPSGVPVYTDGAFPDEIAISNILRRYYYPFHRAVEKTLRAGGIRLILECHTMMAVGPRNSADPDKPRPLATVTNIASREGHRFKTCPDELAAGLLGSIGKHFAGEDATVSERFSLNRPRFEGHILETYGEGRIPMMRLSLSRGLFVTDRYFSYQRMSVSEPRIQDLRRRLWSGIERFYKKYF